MFDKHSLISYRLITCTPHGNSKTMPFIEYVGFHMQFTKLYNRFHRLWKSPGEKQIGSESIVWGIVTVKNHMYLFGRRRKRDVFRIHLEFSLSKVRTSVRRCNSDGQGNYYNEVDTIAWISRLSFIHATTSFHWNHCTKATISLFGHSKVY